MAGSVALASRRLPPMARHYQTRHRQQATESRPERRLPRTVTETEQLILHAIALVLRRVTLDAANSLRGDRLCLQYVFELVLNLRIKLKQRPAREKP